MIETLDEKKRRLLALLLKEKGIDPASAPILPLPRDGRPFPLSFSQERLWIIQELEPESPAYNLAAAFRLVGRLRPGIFARAFTEIARRHEILRTTFAAVDGKPVQTVHPPEPFPIPEVDLSGLPRALREAEASRIAVGEPLRLFDLRHGPLMRVLLLPLGEEERVLLVTTHHIISDGWSENLLIEEAGALYAAFSQGRPSPLPPLPVQYADFAAWQRQALSGTAIEGELDYWRRQLGGSPPVLPLPSDRPRPTVPGLGGGSELVDLPAALAERLKALGRPRGATLFMVILAALEALLAHLSGQEDVSVGTPIASRDRTEIERLIGFFANTLVLRGDLSGDPAFSELLDRARRTAIDAFAHQRVPFSRVVEELKPERSLAYTPLFQVLYVLQNTPGGAAAETPGLRFETFEASVRTAMYDWTVSISEGGWGLSVALEYRTDLWDASTIRRLLGNFETLLRAIVEDPERRLSDLPLLTTPERHALRAEWNDTATAGAGASLAEALAAAAERHAEKTALVFEGQALTYREAEARARELAERLRDLGVGPGSRVALSAGRSPEAVIGLLAILKAGAAYLPLDPAYPEDRRAFMREDSGATVLLTETTCTSVSPSVPPSLDVLAYLIYTSGSTGRPKGVAMTCRALENLLAWQQREALPGPARTLQFASLSFDVSFQEIASTWLTGGTLVLVSEETRRDPFALLALLDRERVERLFLPFVALRQLAEAAETAGGGESLCDVITAGEQLQVTPAVRAWFARTGARLHNQYGPSESHVVTALTLDGDPELWPALPPIGRPIANVAVHLLGPALEPVPVGVPGELCIGGVALARGYLDRPDLTAERFIPDPFGGAGERLYRTGDLARWRTDGAIEYLGRRDGQVKIRGVRVEPGEVETALDAHPGVRGTVAVPLPEPASPGALRLVAFYVPAPAAEPSPAELRDFLAARLPAAIVPSLFVPLEAFPTTPSGKVDRRALAVPEGSAAPSPGYVPPRTSTEERLAGIWAALLGAARVGARDNFFELGGHSLLATQLVSRVREAFGVEIPQRALFEAPTVEELARHVEAAGREEAPPVAPVPRDGGPLPLSFAQERLWFLDQLEPGNPTFNMAASFPLAGDVAPGVLARALSEVARRHEVLRTTFGSEEGRPFQRIASPRPVPLTVVDLGGLAEEAERLEIEESLRPFDLARGPLLRALLLCRGERDWVLLLTLHHTVSDGWSMGLLRRELETLYAAFSAGRPSPLPELPVQYADYAVWQRRWLTGRVLAKQIAYWRSRLAGAPGLDLPTDRPRPALQTFRGETLLHPFPVDLSARLAALARAHGATLFMVLLAGLQALLARLAGQDDVTVGSPVAGRVRTEIEGLLGCFLNNLALRTGLAGNPSFRELLGRARATALEAYEHQDVPFEKLLEEIRPERDLSRTPVFQVFLNMLNLPGEEGGEIAEVHAKFDLTVYAAETAGGLRLSLVYNADLFDRERIAGMAAQLEALLAQAVEDPQARIASLSLVTAAARAVLPDPAAPLSSAWQGGIPEALARQDPERIAVADGVTVRTYGDLRAEAEGLAGLLAANGVGRGDAVAIWAHRSAALPGAVLGILRAGAAFLVLDPAYPAPRLVEYLRLSRPRALVTIPGAPAPPPEVEAEIAFRVDLPAVSADGSAGAPPVESGPDDLAVVTFTSGSTGVPRGIAGRHGPLTHFLPWMAGRFGLSGDDRFGLLSALPHDPLQRDLFTPVWLGAALVVPDPERIGSPGYLAEWVRRHGVTVLNLTPAMLELLVRAAEETGAAMPSLRRVFVVGDLLKRTDAGRLYRVAPGVTCVNLYGATETQRALSYFVVPRGSFPGPEVLPLGRGMEGSQLLVLNAEGALAGVGELGEIHVRSPHLARGYVDEPALTAERFLPDRDAERIYHTGDLGRYRPDGNVEFVGRADSQVKIRGFRIEPGEIEAALARFPGVLQSVVIVRDLRLVAYVVPRPGTEIPPAGVRAFLAGRLPGFLVPADVVVLSALPLTRTGKVDRRALPAPERAAGEGTVAPRTPTEETLAGLWRELLEVETVSVHDDFFGRGGHSLLATQLASRLRTAFGVELPLRALFERSTIAELATLVDERRGEEGPAAPPLVPRPGTAGLPLSFAQQRLWFLHQLDPRSPAYNMYQALRLGGDLDEAALAAALAELVRRQTSLRTRFETRGARPVQTIGPVPALLLPAIDLSGLPAAAREREGERIARQESLRPFDLERGPVFRVLLLRLAPGERGLVVALHHIVSDGWSMGLFVHELTALYRAAVAGEPSPLPELPIRYADFAAWQREWLAGPVLEREAAWWRERLAGAPAVLDLPLDRPRPPLLAFRGARLARAMPAHGAEALLRLGREREATPFMTFLALFAALLLRHTGQEDVVVGSPVANRNRRETEGLIGFFVNTLVLRTDLSGAPGFAALVDRARETALSAYTHQDLPFEKLVEEIAPERSLRHTPLFQVMLVTSGAPPEGSSPAAGLSLSVLNVENGTAKFDLTMIVRESPGRLDVAFGYNADLFFPTTIHRLLAHCEALLEGVVALPGRPVAEIPLLSNAEQHQLLMEWNAAPAEPEEDVPLHQLFFNQAARRPDAPALLSAGGAVTYGELAARALGLARRLAGHGVGPEVPVALLADRSPATIAGLLGILAAGGVYVPLDPSWPQERLAFVPEDAGARLVLTREDLEVDGEPFAPVHVDPDHAAYVIYTSGSTGTPNGVVVPHRGAVNLLRHAQEHYGTGPESRVLQAASPGFDASILEIFLALGSGSALVQVRDEERLTPAVLAERLNALRVTTLVVTPAFLAVLPEPVLKIVESVSVGGEACPAPLAARWSPGRRFLNCYGPTEASIYATVEIGGETSIGRPVAGMEVYLLDADQRPVPLGVAGELCLGGTGLARGYLGKPEKTAAKFIPDPFSGRGERLYRTGDLARQRPDGRLEFLGRIDTQVKVRGVRIEPGEIEAALAVHPQVEAAAVVAHGEGPDRFLAAYVVLSEPAPSPAELRRFLAGSLPDALVPAALVPLPALPLTPSGKVDRRALPVPGRADTGGAAVAPRNELERLLAELWKEALGLSEIGVHDDFFELGGTSIKAAILTNLLQERLGEPVYVVALFDAPTIARLAVYLETHYHGKAVEEVRSTRITEETVERFRALIPPLPPAPPSPKNPRAVFLLSPPRSGSTLLRVMLAGHPALFAPPELELLGFNTLRERKAAFSGRYGFWAEGTVRALMELEGSGSEEAWQIMAGAETRDLSVRDFYREIQERTGGRLLVDKTPSYSLDRATLERAEQDFEKPLYIHLLRHPYGMISSFEKARLEQVFFRVPHPFSRRELAELIWLTSQRNILAFLDNVEPGRQLRLRFEDLVQDPRAAMERVCAFLGIPFTPAMLDPYEDTGRRMTDGIHALSRMVGDVKFHEHKAIDPQVAESWKKEIAEDFLGEPTWKMAESLGYRKKTAPSLVRLQPRGDRPPLIAVHPVGGNVLAYMELARELMPGGRPLWALQSAGLVGHEPHRRIEAMASAYLEEILAARPTGPYPLLGWSLGGSIAFEMARQLGERGQEVPLLVLVDALAPGTLPAESFAEADDDELLAGIAGDLSGLALPPGLGPDPARLLLSVYRANLEAARYYRPTPWPGRALLLRAGSGTDSGWGALVTGGVEVVEIEGDHYSLLRSPRVARLAQEIAARLK
ncbi:MAG TPA: amino acid adenylation domain-containing protein [Thermoanaerobaculia bacterium]|nr:amino acid adenylation domain-containing protein [Thermoanaerobaculia bacterium]